MHCFKVPARLRADSDGLLQHNQLQIGTTAARGTHESTSSTQKNEATFGSLDSTGVHSGEIQDSMSAKAVLGEVTSEPPR